MASRVNSRPRCVAESLGGYDGDMQAPSAGADLAMHVHQDRPGFIRTSFTLVVLLAILVGSWAVVIGFAVLVIRLLT